MSSAWIRARRRWRALEAWPYWWVPALALSITAVVLGFIGFRHSGPPGGGQYSTVEAAYHTLRLFVLGWPDPDPVPPSLDAARFLAALSTVVVAVRAGLALYAGRIEQVRAHRSRDHTIVCGLGRRGTRTVESLLANGHRVVAVEAHPDADGVRAARALGATIVVGDATSPAVLRSGGLRRARRLIVTSGGDETSVEIATAAAAALPRVPGGLSAVVQLEDPDLAAALNERMAAAGGADAALRFTSLLHDGATALVRRHPPPAGGAILIVGLSRFAEAFLAAALRYIRMTDDRSASLHVVIADPDGVRRMARFRVLHPSVADRLEVEVVEGDADSPELDAWLARRRTSDEPPIAQVYVCPDDDPWALSGAIHLARRLPGCPVIVQTASSGESAGRFLGPGRSPASASRIHVFGLVEETCSMELLLDPRNEVIARALHEEYLRHRATTPERPGADATDVPWSELDDEWREANRSHVRHLLSALGSVGVEVLPNDDGADGLLVLTDDEVEALARAEHDRWTADRHRRGWTLGPRDDRRRTHPDLVPWEDLPQDSRDIDRALVRARPRLLARAGFALRRVPANGTRGR